MFSVASEVVWLWNNLEIMLTHLSVVPDFLDREWDGMLPKSKAITSKTQRHHFQTATASLPWSLPKLNGITSKTQRYHFPNSTASLPESLQNRLTTSSANAQLARKRNSYANFVQNQSKNREWIRTTKTAWSESTETATALLVPANMYIIQLHTWECVLLNKLVQTLCLWNNLCIIDCIAGATLLDHLLWKQRSLESCVHPSTFQVDVLYVWL